jgi:hypothetical protein
VDLAVHTLGFEVSPRSRGGRAEDLGKAVGLDPVVLLGHVHPAGAQAGLNVHERHSCGGRGASSGEGGVGISPHDHRVRALGGD